MPYITRGDGEHFVIPSYRDIITSKSKSAIKNEIIALSKNYGEYITLQRKSATKYEVAFSPDRGYLLGESIWHHFKRPLDMVYSEAIPGTTEALLVIVKAGNVYLDGSFPLDSIPEELVVFLTEQNNFEIFTYGEVPISQTPENGKFSFDAASVKSFKQLDQPVFPALALYKPYRFDLADTVLKSQGIGVAPIKQLLVTFIVIGVAWMFWSYISSGEDEVEALPPPPPQINPYLGYLDGLSTPAPDAQVDMLLKELAVFLTMPGWSIKGGNYTNGSLTANVQSPGVKIETLAMWAEANNATLNIRKEGVFVSLERPLKKRQQPENIYRIKQVIAGLIDKLATVYPGNHLQIGELTNHGNYSEMIVTLQFENISPATLQMIGQQMREYPITLQNITLAVNNGSLSGKINLLLLGN